MLINLEHPSNTESEMAVRVVGMCTDAREEQFSKPRTPIVTEPKEEYKKKTYPSSDIILGDNVTQLKEEHPEKNTRCIIFDGNMILLSEEHLEKYYRQEILYWVVIVSSEEHWEKAL